MSFGERLKKLRSESGLTQEALADRLSELLPEGEGISISSISMWENGNRTPESDTQDLIADFF